MYKCVHSNQLNIKATNFYFFLKLRHSLIMSEEKEDVNPVVGNVDKKH